MDWVTNYRKHPNPSRVPAAVHAMLDFGLFGDEEKEWFCIGFIAGVLGTNPKDGPALIPQMFPLPDKEQAVIIRAIAYSGARTGASCSRRIPRACRSGAR